MDWTLFLVQVLNGLQLGILLFLIAAGLTLVFGVMDFINLAHGVQYMLGAYLCVWFVSMGYGFFLAVPLALLLSLAVGLLLETAIFRRLYERDHLYQVLATVGVLLFITEMVEIVFGNDLISLDPPQVLSGSVQLTEVHAYPVMKLAVIAAGLMVAVALWLLVTRTRIGQLVRAGASDATMVSALGVNVQRLFLLVFGFGSMLAAFAGMINAPVLGVETTMGDGVLITSLVVIVIGGIGSIKGAFMGAMIVGLVDTLGRGYATDLVRNPLFFGGLDTSSAYTVGPALASMAIYVLMALVLFFRPRGLFPVKA